MIRMAKEIGRLNIKNTTKNVLTQSNTYNYFTLKIELIEGMGIKNNLSLSFSSGNNETN